MQCAYAQAKWGQARFNKIARGGTMINQAFRLLVEGHLGDAVKTFSDCLSLEPKEARIYRGRGAAYFQLKKWKQAIADFENARQLDSEDPDNWMGLAMSLVMDSKIYEAIDVYEALITDKPRFVNAHIQLALLYYRLGTISKGHQQLDIALNAGPSHNERNRIEEIKKEQLTLDKKRYHKPDFTELRRQNQIAPLGAPFYRIMEVLLSWIKPKKIL